MTPPGSGPAIFRTHGGQHDHDLRVFHARQPTFDADAHPPWPGVYRFVAAVRTDSIEHAYCLTNHIDRDWTRNPEVTAAAPHQRSTSVGDVIVDPHGTPYRCEPVGWSLIR